MVSRSPKITAPLSALCPDKPAPPNSIRRVIPAGNKKVVALTFDLCERADEITGYDYEIVNYLRSHKVRATFFACGKWMQSHPEKAMQFMADPLFEVGYHTVRALPLFVPELRSRGYTFVTVSYLLTLGPVFSPSECYELTPGDNRKYDELFGEGTMRRKKR